MRTTVHCGVLSVAHESVARRPTQKIDALLPRHQRASLTVVRCPKLYCPCRRRIPPPPYRNQRTSPEGESKVWHARQWLLARSSPPCHVCRACPKFEHKDAQTQTRVEPAMEHVARRLATRWLASSRARRREAHHLFCQAPSFFLP